MTKTELLGFYRQMRLIREFERESERQYTKGNIRGFLHVYSGEEVPIPYSLPLEQLATPDAERVAQAVRNLVGR